MQGFVDQTVTQQGELSDRKDSPEENLARNLLTFLKKQNKVFRKVDFKTWVSSFRTLLKVWPVQEVTKVMEYMTNNYQQEWNNQITSAYLFCERYEAIRVRWEVMPLASKEINKEVDSILAELCYSIPAGLPAHLPTITHRNLERAAIFARSFRDYKFALNESGGKAKKENRSLFLFVYHLDSLNFGSARKLTLLWTDDFLRVVSRYTEWRGGFGGFLFDPHSQRFQTIGRRICYEWSGSSRQWEIFMEGMKNG